LTDGFSLALHSLRNFLVKRETACLSCGQGGANSDMLSAEFTRQLLARTIADLGPYLEAAEDADEDIWEVGSVRGSSGSPHTTQVDLGTEPSVDQVRAPSDVDSEDGRNISCDAWDKPNTRGPMEPRGFKPASHGSTETAAPAPPNFKPASRPASRTSLDEMLTTTMSSTAGSSGELRVDAFAMSMDSRGSPAQWARPRRDSNAVADAARPPRPGSAPLGGRSSQTSSVGSRPVIPQYATQKRSRLASQSQRSNPVLARPTRPQSAGPLRSRLKDSR
jgi:hypothetical protein